MRGAAVMLQSPSNIYTTGGKTPPDEKLESIMKKIITTVVAATLLSSASFAFADQKHGNHNHPDKDRPDAVQVFVKKYDNEAALAVATDRQDLLKVDPYSMKYGTSSHTNR